MTPLRPTDDLFGSDDPRARAPFGPVRVLPERLARTAPPPPGGPSACVSITHDGVAPAALAPGYAAVLAVAFDDVDPTRGWPGQAGGRPIGPEDAARIAAFVVAQRAAGVRGFTVHCYYGAGRSAGVALGLLDAWPDPAEAPAALAGDLAATFPVHNRLARRLVAQALRATAPPPP